MLDQSFLQKSILGLISFTLISCGGDGDSGSGPQVVAETEAEVPVDENAGVAVEVPSDAANTTETRVISSGLKIFASEEKHVGDFFNDPTLTGATAIDKADDFCNKSISRPNDANYKALLVDGIHRDAISLTNWIFEPLTDYYRVYDNVKIGTTSESAILTAFWVELDNSIADCDEECWRSDQYSVWTGIENAGDFSGVNNTCDGWSSAGHSTMGRFGTLAYTSGYAFSHSSGRASCVFRKRIYCVEQP